MDLKLLIAIFIILAPFSIATNDTTPAPSGNETDIVFPFVDGDARRSLIAEMFSGPMSREKTRATLKRALELLDGTKKKAIRPSVSTSSLSNHHQRWYRKSSSISILVKNARCRTC